ncbi:hypothetical protein BDP27DRAFT_1371269 [Rhodocollybia butyracea]|uniref:Uncharacterized protein n=1 Tax=Rhodocollybia butyracea TaxID=206335 RepID=A0A9P5TYT0_9AGAR|nr:hypothetical protein BDP27DRAFT_1371269 [Rhodocollybia butyracea]
MPASNVTVQSIKKTQAAIAAAKPGPKTRGAIAKATVPKEAAPKAPSKWELDLKAFALKQKKEAQKKAQQEAQQAKDKAIRKRAKAMREAQTDDNAAGQVLDGLGCRDLDGHGNSPAPSLDENEQGDDEDEELGKPLEEDPDALLFNNAFEDNDGHGEDNEDGTVDAAVDDDMDVDPPSNEIQVSSAPSTRSKSALQRIRHRLGLYSSPSSSSLSVNLVTLPARRKGGEITEKHFTPKTHCLAILGKKMNRRETATNLPCPSDKHAYNMDILQNLANEYNGEEDLREVFARVLASVDTQQELVQFISYAQSGFFTNCMAKAREWVPSFFGIPGKMKSTEVKDIVAWLSKDGRYKYGEVDIQIEHALQEYSEGVYRHVEFSDTARPIYSFHHSSFTRIAKEAPIWANNFSTGLYKLILTQSNKEFLLDVEADDLTEVDIHSLEAEAVAAAPVANKGASSPLPSSSPPSSSPVRL